MACLRQFVFGDRLPSNLAAYFTVKSRAAAVTSAGGERYELRAALVTDSRDFEEEETRQSIRQADRQSGRQSGVTLQW